MQSRLAPTDVSPRSIGHILPRVVCCRQPHRSHLSSTRRLLARCHETKEGHQQVSFISLSLALLAIPIVQMPSYCSILYHLQRINISLLSLSIYQSINLSICLSVYLSLYPSLSIHPSIHPPIHPSSIRLSLSISRSILYISKLIRSSHPLTKHIQLSR